MRRFTYAPDVNVYIDATDYGFIDVSDDVISGSVTRRINAVSNASVTLQNPHKKYLRKIKPMDRIVIYLTRIHQPVLVFSGYVDRSPFDQLYPQPVTITASCTLKRLLNTYWDPALPYVMSWLRQYGWLYNNQNGTLIDPTHNLYNSDFSGGLGHLLRAVMNDVGGWPIGIKGQSKNTVHVMALPDAFLKKTKAILTSELQSIQRQQEVIDRVLNTLLSSNGVSVSVDGTTVGSMDMNDDVADTDPLPPDVAKRQWNATIFGEKVDPSVISADRIDAYLVTKSSPLAGYGADFVTSGKIHGVDPRLIVAISGAETSFGTAGPGPAVHNAWGLFTSSSTNIPYATWKEGIDAATSNISSSRYFGRGATTIPAIGAIWAPVGASNDPNNLNSNWVTTVSKFYQELGGDPSQSVRYGDNISAGETKPLGQIGDVKTSMLSFFKARIAGGVAKTSPSGSIGHTFKIKGNPYGEDDLLFRAIYDGDIPDGTISIYVPGAKGKGTSWAQNWTNKKVTLETSYGSSPFAGKATKVSSTGQSSLGGKVSGEGIQLPTFQNPTHQTAGLPGFPAVDIFATPGTPVGAPEKGQLTRISGHPPSQPPPEGQGGPWGMSLYYLGTETGNIYFGTHLQQVADVGNYNKGDIIGVIGDYPGSTPDHIHWGINSSPDASAFSIARARSTLQGSGQLASGDIPMTSQGVLGTTGVHANQQDMAALAASTVYGIELGFPDVGDASEALLLTGSRALANDVPLFGWIEFICKASGRNFQSMPNGDFLAFYPDHFNWSGTAPYFRISPIETIDLTIDISDEELTTHVFTTGDTYYDGLSFLDRVASTVSSVTSPAFKQLVDVDKDFNAFNFLKRYGARPWQEDRPELKNSFMQFMYGWMTFLDKWAKQFYCDAEFTFLPELFPGGIVDFPPPHNLKMYVEEVTHNFDRANGFTTSASLTSPSHYGKSQGTTAMVLADGGLKNVSGS